MHTSNNSSCVLHQQQKPQHWAVPGGAVGTWQRAGQLRTTTAHSSKVWWSRNSCLGKGTSPTDQKSPSTQAELEAVAISAVSAGAALCKHLNKWLVSYVGVKSSASSECKFSIYQTMVPSNSLAKGCSFPPLSFPLHTCAARSSLACSRIRKTVILWHVCGIHLILLG